MRIYQIRMESAEDSTHVVSRWESSRSRLSSLKRECHEAFNELWPDETHCEPESIEHDLDSGKGNLIEFLNEHCG